MIPKRHRGPGHEEPAELLPPRATRGSARNGTGPSGST